jgi:hypothetical protein
MKPLPPGLKRILWIGYPLHVTEFVQAAASLLQELGLSIDCWTAKEWPSTQRLQDNSTLFIITRGLESGKCPQLPLNYIVHQVEQCSSAALKDPNSNYVSFLRKALWIWDYSSLNAVFLRCQLGLNNVSLLEFAYHPKLEFSASLEAIPCDILFLGQPCQRRMQMLYLFRKAGLQVRSESNVFGVEKARLIRGAKIVLNLHYYTNPSILETERLAVLLANRKCIVSETSSEEEKDTFYSEAVVFESDPVKLVERCKELLANEQLRQSVEQQGYEWFTEKMRLEHRWQDLESLVNYFQ